MNTSIHTHTHVMNRLKRTLPYLRALSRARNKKLVLKSFPAFVVDDMIEILYNVLLKNAKLRNLSHRRVLLRNKSTLSRLMTYTKNKKLLRSKVYQQKGGFLSAIIPVAASVLTGLLGSTL